MKDKSDRTTVDAFATIHSDDDTDKKIEKVERLSFEQWWDKFWKPTKQPEAMYLAWKEVAKKAWDAGYAEGAYEAHKIRSMYP